MPYLDNEGYYHIDEGAYDDLIRERDEARTLVRQYDRLADHLLLMHRRENRVMEGGEEERQRLLALWRVWPAAKPAEE